MINDMKRGIKLLRYAYGIKMNVMLGIGCVIIDMVCFILQLAGFRLLDGYFLLAVGLLPTQLIFTLNMADITLSSPLRKKMQISIPAVLNWYTMMGMYLIIILKKLVIVLVHPDSLERVCTQLVFLALLAAFIMACTGLLYKYYIICLLMVMVLSGAVQFILQDFVHWEFLGQNMFSLVCAALIGFVLITAAVPLEYGLSLLVYKAPVSKTSMGAALRSQL